MAETKKKSPSKVSDVQKLKEEIEQLKLDIQWLQRQIDELKYRKHK
jgi:SMC interacting uncharacterized protein involved in chromosome segregation